MSAWFVIWCLARFCSFITWCLFFITVLPQVCLHPFCSYPFPFTLPLPSPTYSSSRLLPLYKAMCIATVCFKWSTFFPLALSTFCPSWSKLHSWDSPFLLALKPLFAVMFVKIGKKVFVCGSYLNYCFFLLWSDCPLAVNCLARLFQFTSAVPRLGLSNSTRTSSALSFCPFTDPIVYALQQHYALGVQLQTCLKEVCWGQGGRRWGNTM